ncbi:Avirulence protein (Avh) [Phytophthora palmivora]|uniref:Avirulence protein (Avh) n=1 Tax=Phytophthora palmivora TaxID=4796 RepID=A0A2P4XKL6_9STRA|nr:Avirulence protein (Avh) [Phytophthora palmivora]
MRLSISALVLFLSVATTFVCGDALSTSSDSAVKAGSRVNLRSLVLATTDDNTPDEERAVLNFGSLKNLIPGYKAAQVAKAAKKAEEYKKYTLLLERDDHLYKAMAEWRGSGKPAITIYNHMIAVGKTTDEAETIFFRYNNYLQEKMGIQRVVVHKPL